MFASMMSTAVSFNASPAIANDNQTDRHRQTDRQRVVEAERQAAGRRQCGGSGSVMLTTK